MGFTAHMRYLLLLLFCVIFLHGQSNSGEVIEFVYLDEQQQAELFASLQSGKPSPLLQRVFKTARKGKKLNAALLAFPFPCGIVGLHRIYLGTAPYIPVVYIASFGGAFGILPFIDFCVLLLDQDIEPYVRNPKVFMWSR